MSHLVGANRPTMLRKPSPRRLLGLSADVSEIPARAARSTRATRFIVNPFQRLAHIRFLFSGVAVARRLAFLLAGS
jgi:hypothetical protein